MWNPAFESLKPYIFTTPEAMATKLVRVVTYCKGLQLITLLSCDFASTCDKLKSFYLHYQRVYEYQTYHNAYGHYPSKNDDLA